MVRLRFAFVIAAVTFFASAVSVSAAASGFDCRQLIDKPQPVSASDWLKRSLLAGHCYAFQARAVRISREGVRTLALSHDIQDGIVREVASYLDGPPVVYERHGKIIRSNVGNSNPAMSTPFDTVRVEQHYRMALNGEERIAGRRSVRLDIEPLDNLRYGHRLWLDIDTALPLKQVLIDTDGHTLETFQMTELVDPALYDQSVSFEILSNSPSGPWQPGWLPSGYELVPLPEKNEVADRVLAHRLYSDGLSSFSLFIEPVRAESVALRPGLHRLGISYAAVRHLQMNDRLMQIVVMGELPPQVLVRVAAELEYQPDKSPATASAP